MDSTPAMPIRGSRRPVATPSISAASPVPRATNSSAPEVPVLAPDRSAECVTCGKPLAGTYCWNCGEKRLEEHDYSLKHFVKHAIEAFTHVDANFFRSVRLLLTKPGSLTFEYLVGRRKFHIGPLQLFLLVNVLYFLLQPLIGWNNLTTSLATHLNDEFYSPLARRFVEGAMAKTNMGLTEFEQKFDQISVTHAKSMVILMVPMLAIVLALVYRRARKYYVEHLVFSLHFFAFWLIITTVLLVLTELVINLSSGSQIPIGWQAIEFASSSAAFLVSTWYFGSGGRRVYDEPLVPALVKGVISALAVIYILKVYRMILFFTTLWSLRG